MAGQSILRYAEKYEKCNFVVSGRPDDSFKSWELFSTLKAVPLEPIQEEWIHEQVFGLVNRLSMRRIIARRMNAATVVA